MQEPTLFGLEDSTPGDAAEGATTTPEETPQNSDLIDNDFEYRQIPMPSAFIPSRDGPIPALVHYGSFVVPGDRLASAMTEVADGGMPVVHVLKDHGESYRVIYAQHFVKVPKPKLIQTANVVPPPKIFREED